MKIAGIEYLQSKHHATSGAHRVRAPQATFADYSRQMSRMGITRLANITGLDRVGIPVYLAIRPNSRSLATSQGKGIDKEHARVSALMESAENWHAEHIELPTRVESYWRLAERHRVLDVFEIPLRPGAALHPEVPMVWIQGYDLLSQESVWVPYECTTMNTVLKFALALTFYTSSNGLASGNHILEATNHALFELIERDSHAEWLDHSEAVRRSTKIDPSSVTDLECKAMLERFGDAGLAVAIWDITSSGFAIPAYMVQVVGADEGPVWRRVGLCTGRGCHLSPVVALSRALAEAAQSRLTIISGSRDDNLPVTYESQTRELWFAQWRAAYFDPAPVLRFGDRVDESKETLEEDLERILSRLRNKNIKQIAVVDLTQPGIGIPVVRVVAPGLAIANEAGETVALPPSRRT